MHEPNLDMDPFENNYNVPTLMPEVLREEHEILSSIEEFGNDVSATFGAHCSFNKPDCLMLERISSDTLTRPSGEDSLRMFGDDSSSASPSRLRGFSFHVEDQIS